MQKNKAIFYGSVFIIAIQAHSCSYAMSAEETINLAYDATQKAGAGILPSVIGAGACVNLVVNLYGIGKDVKSYISPTEKEKNHAKDVDKELKLMRLRKDLRTCLLNNRSSSERRSLGVPPQCEEMALMLGLKGAPVEATRMAELFNLFNK